jgi:uncharacterized protein (DUF488 family)
MDPEQPIFTIGHSTRTIAEFADILQRSAVDLVVDVRTIRRSRHNPQYNEELLGDALAPYAIGYSPAPRLGGLRGGSGVPPETNAFWKNQSFHNYADYTLTDEFAGALSELLETSSDHRCALMCAEAVWWRCHRRIIADYLLTSGREVFHLMGNGRADRAEVTSAARSRGRGLIYPPK